MVNASFANKVVLGSASAVLALALVVLSGWVFSVPMLVRIVPQWVPMVVNTALCFVLSATALWSILLPRYTRRIQLTLGTLVVGIASVELFQVITGLAAPWDLAELHRPLQPEYSRPGQMAPNTALGFILFGIGLILHHRLVGPRRGAWLRVVTFSVIAIGVVGMLGYFLKIDILYNWTGVVRMALHTGVGMTMLGVGLWHLWRASDHRVDHSDQGEVLRIHRVSTGLLIFTAATAGVMGTGLIQDRIEKLMGENLARMVQDRRVMFAEIIAHRTLRAAVVAENPALVRLVRDLPQGTPLVQSALAEHALKLQQLGFMALVYESPQAQWQTSAPLIAHPDMALELRGPYPAQLLWKDGYILRTRIPMRDDAGLAGYFIADQALPILTKMSSEIREWGATGDMLVCAADGEQLRCFPRRTSPEVFVTQNTYGKQALPMTHALRQEIGVMKALDYRGPRVLAAYGPIGQTDLGMVLQMDVAEIYAPIREQFQVAMPVLALLVLASAWFMRTQLRPLLSTLVTSRSNARKNEARFVAAAQGSLDAFLILESERDARGVIQDFRFVFLNSSAIAMLELSDDPVGRTLGEVFPHYRSNGSYEKFLSVLQHDAPLTEETASTTQPGRVWRRQQIVKLGDGVAVTLQDITERKRVEHLQHEFISTVSHELRTPLTAIRGALGLVTGGVLGELPPKARKMLQIADENSARLAKLINDLLDMEKLIAQGLSFDLQTHRLLPLIEQAIRANNPYAEQHQVRYVLVAQSPDMQVNIDSQRLMQVATNLLSNAAKFSPPGTKIDVVVDQIDGAARVSVIDHGNGIALDFQPRVFQKFSQADASDTRQKGGTGLGLAISKELIEQMGGQIGFSSVPGQGACFYFTLPLIHMAAAQAAS